MATNLRLLSEGKTKRIFADPDPTFCIVENKADITAHDDPSFTRQFATKAISSTATTCRVFELLRDAWQHVAYLKQMSDTTFQAPLCRMIPLECVARRIAAGSYLKRNPHVADGTRFHRLEVEFYLKTTQGSLRTYDGRILKLDLTHIKAGGQSSIIDDPLIDIYDSGAWILRHPKLPRSQDGSLLGTTVQRSDVLPDRLIIAKIEEATRKAFLVLERAWGQLGHKLVDLKVEFGINAKGELLLADVIDNDNWRLRTSDDKEVSKQLFRDGHPLAEVEEKYALVARLVERFASHSRLLCCGGGQRRMTSEMCQLFLASSWRRSRVRRTNHQLTR